MTENICKYVKNEEECEECDLEFRISQKFPCGQSGSSHSQERSSDFILTAKDSIKDFNNFLITKNNDTNEDKGVHECKLALDDPSFKAVKKLTKDKILATMGFLKDMSLNKAKEVYKKVYVEDLCVRNS